jgi:hypothetical protein
MFTYLRIYLTNWLIWLDEGLNTLRGGDPGQSLSVAAGIAQTQGKRWGCILCRFLSWFQANHCAKAVANEGKHSLWGD